MGSPKEWLVVSEVPFQTNLYYAFASQGYDVKGKSRPVTDNVMPAHVKIGVVIHVPNRNTIPIQTTRTYTNNNMQQLAKQNSKTYKHYTNKHQRHIATITLLNNKHTLIIILLL